MTLAPETTTEDYRNAPGGDGPLAAQWKDKPHRLIYDLCGEVERLQALMEAVKTYADIKARAEEPTAEQRVASETKWQSVVRRVEVLAAEVVKGE